jgi:cytochrome P450
MAGVLEQNQQMAMALLANINEIRENTRPGIINGLLNLRIDGEPAPDMEILGMLTLLIGGGFDATTALTALLDEHLAAGADHLPIRVLTSPDTLLAALTELAGPLALPRPRVEAQ